MKATLEFNLNEPDDRTSHLRAVKSLDMASFIFELTHNTRKKLQMEAETLKLDNVEAISLVFEEIYSMLNENSIDINELIN